MSTIDEPLLPKVWHKFKKLRHLPARHWYDLRNLMRLRKTQLDQKVGRRVRFVSDSFYAHLRAKELLSKEPETNSWLEKHVKPSDIFLDIGANVGVFSLYVGMRLDDKGHVYACEPHMPSAVQLMQNIAANDLGDKVSVISVALGAENGFTEFSYRRWGSGASGSQLQVDSGVTMPKSVGVELKCQRTVDQLIEDGVMPPPNLVKIDTDGVELFITKGMEKLLTGKNKPKALLIEVQVGDFAAQKQFMESCGYQMVGSAAYSKSKTRLDAGATLDDVAFNAFFEPKSS